MAGQTDLSTCKQATCIQVILFYSLGMQLALEEKKSYKLAQTSHLYTLLLPSYLTLITAERNSGTKAGWMLYLWKKCIVLHGKVLLALSAWHFLINSKCIMGALWPCGKHVQGHSYTMPHLDTCSTEPSTVGWKRGMKLLVCMFHGLYKIALYTHIVPPTQTTN